MPVVIEYDTPEGPRERELADGYSIETEGGWLLVRDRNGTTIAAHAAGPGTRARQVEHASAAAPEQVELGAAGGSEPLKAQIARLAQFITEQIPGEPSRSEGAVDCAIRLLQELSGDADRYARSITTLERQRDEARAERDTARGELALGRSEWDARSAEGREQVRRLVADNDALRRQAAGIPLQASVETIELGEVEYVDGQIGWLLTRDVLDSLNVMMGSPPQARSAQPPLRVAEAGDDGDRFAPELLTELGGLGEHYGPLGVALAAASLSDPFVVVHHLTHEDLTVVEEQPVTAAVVADDERPDRSPLDGVTLTYGELRRLIALHVDTVGKTLTRLAPWEDAARYAEQMSSGELALRLSDVLGNIDHEPPTRCTLRVGDRVSVEDGEGKGLSGVVESWDVNDEQTHVTVTIEVR